MTTLFNIPLHGFRFETLVQLSILNKEMHSFATEEMSTRNKTEELCSYAKALPSTEHKQRFVETRLSVDEKWLMIEMLAGSNRVFPCFEPINFASTEIREQGGSRTTIMKEWSVDNMSRLCGEVYMAKSAHELLSKMFEELDKVYGYDVSKPLADDENVAYGWAGAGGYFYVLDFTTRSCQHTNVLEIGTSKYTPMFFLFESRQVVLDKILVFLLTV